ncbi:NAD(P)-binding protein [Thelephora terrestris]|uniref:NAD(P)-binding protein n=1 Tax=Thelephora terrestris TaxID=56493 RepID=A0A9P6HIT7_9AGAM|nr:NAD(P)-binding protein [Thelephora terrestris]
MAPVLTLIAVTASSGGFGRSLVELILKGGDIAVATLRNPSALEDLRQTYGESHLLLLPLDVTNAEQVKDAFRAATDKYGRIDFVYNLAGHGLIAEVEGTPEEDARALFDVNFWGATRVSNEAVRVFREVNKPQGGHLFVITSLVGLKPMAGTGFYSASKHALEGVTEAMSMELHPSWNIKITIIEPGSFRTKAIKENLKVLPPHLAYSDDCLPSKQLRDFLPLITTDNDPQKLSEVVYSQVACDPNPPLRLPLGEDAVGLANSKFADLTKAVQMGGVFSEAVKFSGNRVM